MRSDKGVLAVVSGFAGTGKGTLMKRLVQNYSNYALSISMTTRAMRSGEQDGVDYFFVSRERFEEEIAEDGLIEYANYVDNYYGTPREYVERMRDEGKDVILEIEVQGALKVKEKFPDAVLIFILPPSMKELRNRLIGRGTETLEVIDKRIHRAVEEAVDIPKYDYIVINDDLDVCEKDLHDIIRSEHFRPGKNMEFIKKIQAELEEIGRES